MEELVTKGDPVLTFGLFTDNLKLAFFLEKDSKIGAAVFNSIGQEVQVLASGNFSEGEHYLTFETFSLMPGVYFLKLDIGYKHYTKAVIKTASE